MLGTASQHGGLHVSNAIEVLEEMLSKPLFSVLLDRLVTTSPNKFFVLAAATDYEEEGKRDRNGESE